MTRRNANQTNRYKRNKDFPDRNEVFKIINTAHDVYPLIGRYDVVLSLTDDLEKKDAMEKLIKTSKDMQGGLSMLKVEFDQETLDQLAVSVAEWVVPKIMEQFHHLNDWPPVLNRKQAMKYLDIKENKLNELSRRSDFPVNRELGYPKYPTRLLQIWIEENTDWVRENTGFFNRVG